jgi:hypothetical protein
MIMSYGIIAVPTGIFTMELREAARAKETRACPNCGQLKRIARRASAGAAASRSSKAREIERGRASHHVGERNVAQQANAPFRRFSKRASAAAAGKPPWRGSLVPDCYC